MSSTTLQLPRKDAVAWETPDVGTILLGGNETETESFYGNETKTKTMKITEYNRYEDRLFNM